MEKFSFLNNFTEPVCAFSRDKQVLFKNASFLSDFGAISSFERFKKRFNFNLCFLSSDSLTNLTPIDILLNSEENVHTICTYQNLKEEYVHYYLYTFQYEDSKILVFKDVTDKDYLDNLKKKVNDLIITFNK